MKDLKTLLEGLFDSDLISQDAEFGSLYELSETAHHCRVSNDLDQVMRCFNKMKLDQQASKTKYKVDKRNGFVEYWGAPTRYPDLINLIDVILGMPAHLILSAQYENGNTYAQRMTRGDEKKVKEYLNKFMSRPKDLTINILRFPTKEETIYDIELIEGIFDMRPNRLELRFLEK